MDQKSHEGTPDFLDTPEELTKIVAEQEGEESIAEDKSNEDLSEVEKADKLVAGMEAGDKSRNDDRIKDELSDRKEEDGGDYRE